MVGYKLRIFVRVIKKRIADEGISAEEALESYPKLTEKEKQEILNAIAKTDK